MRGGGWMEDWATTWLPLREHPARESLAHPCAKLNHNNR